MDLHHRSTSIHFESRTKNFGFQWNNNSKSDLRHEQRLQSDVAEIIFTIAVHTNLNQQAPSFKTQRKRLLMDRWGVFPSGRDCYPQRREEKKRKKRSWKGSQREKILSLRRASARGSLGVPPCLLVSHCSGVRYQSQNTARGKGVGVSERAWDSSSAISLSPSLHLQYVTLSLSRSPTLPSTLHLCVTPSVRAQSRKLSSSYRSQTLPFWKKKKDTQRTFLFVFWLYGGKRPNQSGTQ